MRNKKIYIPKKVKEQIDKTSDWGTQKLLEELPWVSIKVSKKAIMVYYKNQYIGNLYINTYHEIVRPHGFNCDKNTYKSILDWSSEESLISLLKRLVLIYGNQQF